MNMSNICCIGMKRVSNFTPKKYYEIDPRGLYYNTFDGRNLRIEYLSLASLSSLVECLRVRLEPYYENP